MMITSMEINVLVDEDAGGNIEAGCLRTLTEQVLAAQGVGSDVELGLVITDQQRVRELNRDYLGRDESTDVLAFSMLPVAEEGGADLPPFIAPPDGVRHLGEVIISYPQAALQAEERHHSVRKEIAILVIHGVLHLLGFDHEEPEQERQMSAREADILSHVEGRW